MWINFIVQSLLESFVHSLVRKTKFSSSLNFFLQLILKLYCYFLKIGLRLNFCLFMKCNMQQNIKTICSDNLPKTLLNCHSLTIHIFFKFTSDFYKHFESACGLLMVLKIPQKFPGDPRINLKVSEASTYCSQLPKKC